MQYSIYSLPSLPYYWFAIAMLCIWWLRSFRKINIKSTSKKHIRSLLCQLIIISAIAVFSTIMLLITTTDYTN
ncbi:putative membrane protein [Bacillus phage SP-15]|uniref:Putative membrane protein n=1 Tax=Bacillus phage SP-15 TaxID=1792032 RepID=A0A127AXP8_9CAUD|nr:hypothetical protein SP15_184B [Bacillus phage SP-15]AMM44984.1 putative membrane protein [Bacillus phage SP-15]